MIHHHWLGIDASSKSLKIASNFCPVPSTLHSCDLFFPSIIVSLLTTCRKCV